MEMSRQNLIAFVFCICFAAALIDGSTEDERKPYIVYMGDLPAEGVSVEKHHHMLSSAIGVHSIARETHIHSYGKSFNGFAARLLPHEVERLQEDENVVSVFESKVRELHTTRSWDFLGMPQKVKETTRKAQSDIVVGLLDSGIYMDIPSFNDEGYGPPPAKWKGSCMKGANFTGCNNKVIGAKYFYIGGHPNPTYDPPSPADYQGHGTHTASTIAGVAVDGASVYGVAKGTARGGVPSARIAMYKVCWIMGCHDVDILAAFDEAIADGVDVISVSLGGYVYDYIYDAIAIGSFHAMKKGILTSCSAGNNGPYLGSIENVSPWTLTVAANSIDRGFKTEIELGNNKKIPGISVNTFSPKKRMYPLTDGIRASNLTVDTYGNKSACGYGIMDQKKVKGSVQYCLGAEGQDGDLANLGSAGVIMARTDKMDVAFATIIAGTFVTVENGMIIGNYINTTKNPQAVIHKTTTCKIDAPFVASFSSRGPQRLATNILKPDLSAPGLNILAGYSKLMTTSGYYNDPRFYQFNVLSGTSMSCPHASAAAAYVKTFHPDWSPAMIKSALMTTATPMKIRDQYGELASGSGQINPVKAVHPGLVYDINMSGYLSFLCKQGYNSTKIGKMIGGKKQYSCSSFKQAQGIDGLNYPSMHTQINGTSSSVSAVFYRTVTNVGYGSSVYKATVTAPEGLFVKVIPDTLEFKQVHQKQSFKVVVKGKFKEGAELLSGLLEWNDARHSVRSPIVVYRHPEV